MTAEATLPDTGGFPRFSSTFVGRDKEIEAILAMLDRPQCRLLTIIGPGGAGKTRLAAEVSARLQASHQRLGYHFVDLSAVEGNDAPALAIADAFGVSLPQVDGNGDELLAEALRDRAAVALLDKLRTPGGHLRRAGGVDGGTVPGASLHRHLPGGAERAA